MAIEVGIPAFPLFTLPPSIEDPKLPEAVTAWYATALAAAVELAHEVDSLLAKIETADDQVLAWLKAWVDDPDEAFNTWTYLLDVSGSARAVDLLTGTG